MTQDTTPTIGAADLPEAGCSKHHLIHCSQCRHDNMVRDLRAENDRLHELVAGQATPAQPVAEPAKQAVTHLEYKQFLSDVMTAAGLVTHGKRCKALGDRLADMTMRLCASHGQAPAPPDPAYSAACHLATALFKKHFAHLPDFASGQAEWGLCSSTAGVISQIDNMVSGLVQPPTTAFSEDEL